MNIVMADFKSTSLPWLKKLRIYFLAKMLWIVLKNSFLTIEFLMGIFIFTIPDMAHYQLIKKKKVREVMIVSHPDDESLFFSQVLLHGEKSITVFCLTNGYNPIRRHEFYQAIKYYGVNGHILKIPDETILYFLFNNKTIMHIVKKLNKTYNNISLIYTHNREGEYGHKHHRITSDIVAKVFKNSKIMVPISSSEIKEDTYLLSENELEAKKFVFNKLYKSQTVDVQKLLTVWFQHESLVKYSPGKL